MKKFEEWLEKKDPELYNEIIGAIIGGVTKLAKGAIGAVKDVVGTGADLAGKVVGSVTSASGTTGTGSRPSMKKKSKKKQKKN